MCVERCFFLLGGERERQRLLFLLDVNVLLPSAHAYLPTYGEPSQYWHEKTLDAGGRTLKGARLLSSLLFSVACSSRMLYYFERADLFILIMIGRKHR